MNATITESYEDDKKTEINSETKYEERKKTKDKGEREENGVEKNGKEEEKKSKESLIPLTLMNDFEKEEEEEQEDKQEDEREKEQEDKDEQEDELKEEQEYEQEKEQEEEDEQEDELKEEQEYEQEKEQEEEDEQEDELKEEQEYEQEKEQEEEDEQEDEDEEEEEKKEEKNFRNLLFDKLFELFESWEGVLLFHGKLNSVFQHKKIWNKNFAKTQELIDQVFRLSSRYKDDKKIRAGEKKPETQPKKNKEKLKEFIRDDFAKKTSSNEFDVLYEKCIERKKIEKEIKNLKKCRKYTAKLPNRQENELYKEEEKKELERLLELKKRLEEPKDSTSEKKAKKNTENLKLETVDDGYMKYLEKREERSHVRELLKKLYGLEDMGDEEEEVCVCERFRFKVENPKNVKKTKTMVSLKTSKDDENQNEKKYENEEWLQSTAQSTIKNIYNILLRSAIYAYNYRIETPEKNVSKGKNLPKILCLNKVLSQLNLLKQGLDLKFGSLEQDMRNLVATPRSMVNLMEGLADSISRVYPKKEKKPVKFDTSMGSVKTSTFYHSTPEAPKKTSDSSSFKSAKQLCSHLLVSATKRKHSNLTNNILDFSELIEQISNLFYLFCAFHNSDRMKELFREKKLKVYPNFFVLMSVQLLCQVLTDLDFCWQATGLEDKDKKLLLIIIDEFCSSYIKFNRILVKNKGAMQNQVPIRAIKSNKKQENQFDQKAIRLDLALLNKAHFKESAPKYKKYTRGPENLSKDTWADFETGIMKFLADMTGVPEKDLSNSSYFSDELAPYEFNSKRQKPQQTSILKNVDEIEPMVRSDYKGPVDSIFNAKPLKKNYSYLKLQKMKQSNFSSETQGKPSTLKKYSSKSQKYERSNVDSKKNTKDNMLFYNSTKRSRASTFRNSTATSHLMKISFKSGAKSTQREDVQGAPYVSTRSRPSKRIYRSKKSTGNRFVSTKAKPGASQTAGRKNPSLASFSNAELVAIKSSSEAIMSIIENFYDTDAAKLSIMDVNNEIMKLCTLLPNIDLQELQTQLGNRGIHFPQLDKAVENMEEDSDDTLDDTITDMGQDEEERVKKFFQTYWEPLLLKAAKQVDVDLNAIYKNDGKDEKVDQQAKEVMEHPLVKPMFKNIELTIDPVIVGNALGTLSMRDSKMLGRRFTYRDLKNPDLSKVRKFTVVDETLKARQSVTYPVNLLPSSDPKENEEDRPLPLSMNPNLGREMKLLQKLLKKRVSENYLKLKPIEDEVAEIFIGQLNIHTVSEIQQNNSIMKNKILANKNTQSLEHLEMAS